MQLYQFQNQSDFNFTSQKSKESIFQTPELEKKDFFSFYKIQNSKLKVHQLNNQQAKTIYFNLNQKNIVKINESRKNWKHEQVCLLVYLLQKMCLHFKIQNISLMQNEIWQIISTYLPGRLYQDCKYKILSLTASTITNIPWSIEQRNLLMAIIQQQGMNWNIISQKFYENNAKKIFRTSKQCRQHYMCFLKPNLKKGAWTVQQDYKLMCLFLQFGRKWSKIMRLIEGRNENSVKNRFFLLFQSKGRNLNNSDLLKKVKRKKQKMQKSLKDSGVDLEMISQNVEPEHGIVGSMVKIEPNFMEKQVESQTHKGPEGQLSGYFANTDPCGVYYSHEIEETQSKQKIVLNLVPSYEHLDFLKHPQIQIEGCSGSPFEEFQRFICF